MGIEESFDAALGHNTPKRAVHDHATLQWNYERQYMLRWAAIFLVIAIVAALLGFGGIAGAAAGIAKFLFFLFVAIFVLFLLLGLFIGRNM
jgi:uncharacterized membrane protein YtjA (UPF0391 family)